MRPAWAAARVQVPEQAVPAQEQERVPVALELARVPVHQPAAQAQERALGPVPARAAQVREQVLALVLPALRPAPEQVQELATEPALVVVLEVELVAARELLAEPQQERLVVLQERPAAMPPHLLQAMAAWVALPRREARREAAVSPAFGGAFSAANQTASRRRLLLRR